MNGERYTFIKLTRSLVYSDSFMSEKMLKVWIWCLIRANHKQKPVPIKIGTGQKTVQVKRGDFIFGRWTASEELNMAGSTVTGIMKKLQEMGNIKIIPNNNYSVVTVCNYDLYQGTELYGSTADEQPPDTNKKEKKNNKDIYDNFLVIFKDITKKNIRVLNDKVKGQLNARIKEGFTLGDFQTAIENCNNDDFHKKNTKYLTPEFITRSDKLQMYLNVEPSKRLGDSKHKPLKSKSFFD